MGMFLMTVSPLGRLSTLDLCTRRMCISATFFGLPLESATSTGSIARLTNHPRQSKAKAMPRPIPTRNFALGRALSVILPPRLTQCLFQSFYGFLVLLDPLLQNFGNRTLLEMSWPFPRMQSNPPCWQRRLTIPRLFRSSRTGLRSKVSPLAKNRIASIMPEADGIFR